MTTLRTFLAASAALALYAGCTREAEADPVGEPTTGLNEAPTPRVDLMPQNLEPEIGVAVTAQAAVEIAAARCERESRCGRVGPGRSYEDGDDCIDEVRDGSSVELAAYECIEGVVRSELSECIAEIRREECDSSALLTTMTECSSIDICA
jgi:hypothetical protein